MSNEKSKGGAAPATRNPGYRNRVQWEQDGQTLTGTIVAASDDNGGGYFVVVPDVKPSEFCAVYWYRKSGRVKTVKAIYDEPEDDKKTRRI